jgi:L-malate glycosyltransferase
MTARKIKPVRVLQIVDTFAAHDGIGNIIQNLHDKLTKAGAGALIFAVLNKATGVTRQTSEEVRVSLLEYHAKGFRFIYHYGSVSPELDSVLLPLAENVILYYHNITPPVYWRYWSGEAYKRCLQGEKNLTKFLSAGCLMTGASWYNLSLAKEFSATRIIPPVLPPTLAKRSVKSPKKFTSKIRLVFIGRFAPNKRQDLLIASAYALKKRGVSFHLILVGEAGDRYGVYIRMLIRLCGLAKCVEIRSNLDEDQMRTLYENSDFFVAATEHEGYCMPVADALEYDVVPILRPIPVFCDFFGNTGVLAPSLSEADFVEHVSRLVSEFAAQPEQRKKLLGAVKNSVERARKKYLTPQEFAAQLARDTIPRKKIKYHESPPQHTIGKALRLPWCYRAMDLLRRRVIQTQLFFLSSAVYLKIKRILGSRQ